MSDNKSNNNYDNLPEITQGAVWQRTTREGNRPYLYIKLTVEGKEYCMFAFKNDFKQDGEKTPDFRTKRIPVDQPQGQQSVNKNVASSQSRPTARTNAPTRQTTAQRPTSTRQARVTVTPPVDDSANGLNEDDAVLL